MKALLSLIICVFALPALAGQGAYFKGGLGYSIGGESKVSIAGLSGSEDLDSSFLHPLLLAYGMHMSETTALEFEFTHRDGEFEGGSDFNALLLGVNGIFNTNIDGSSAKPFFGAGLVIGNYEIGESDAEFGAGLQLLAGADFLMNEKSSIGLELRHHIQVVKPEYDTGLSEKVEVENTITELLVSYKVSI